MGHLIAGSNSGRERALPITLGQVCKPGPRNRGGGGVAMALPTALQGDKQSLEQQQKPPRENNARALLDSPAERGGEQGHCP